MALESDAHAASRRKALKVAVAALCSEVGFGMAEDSALETLTEMLQACMYESTFLDMWLSCIKYVHPKKFMKLKTCIMFLCLDITEVGQSTRSYSELAGRTESMVSDVVMALVEMGKISCIRYYF